jgi:hypothetical protein
VRAFFKGWRRKVGCVTLMVSLALVGAWIRSSRVFDHISFAIGNRQYEIRSIGNHVWWRSWEPVRLKPDWSSSSLLSKERVTDLSAKVDGEYRMMRGLVRLRFALWNADYWSITMPLTLLSAYLILWKPRKKPNAQQIDPL